MGAHREARQQFIEDAGDLLEDHGLPHMAGRVMGALLVCVPPEMSMDELAEMLQASKGSISTATQLMLRFGFIEKISRPGHRKHYYRIRRDVWSHIIEQDTAHLVTHTALVDAGLALMEGEPEPTKERLLEMRLFTEFIEEEMPALLVRWEARREAFHAARAATLQRS